MGALALLAATVPIGGAGAATGDGYMYEIGSGGQYAFDQGRQSDNDSSMDGLVKVYLDGDWAISGSLVDADVGEYTLAVGVAGTCAGNTPLFEISVDTDPEITDFNWDGTPTLPAGYDFIRIYKTGELCQTNWSSYTATDNHGEITSPSDGDILMAGDTLMLGATYYDDDFDPVQWAVREGTCDMVATQVRAGNVAGFNTPFDWDGMTFGSAIDTAGWAAGDYCFIFNPTNEGSENYVRETQWFRIADGHINGGGQIIEEIVDENKPYKVSFGGHLWQFGDAAECEWTVQFHKVSIEAVSGGTFHGSSCSVPGAFPDGGADGVTNFAVYGTLNGVAGHTVIIRMEDFTEPGKQDTIRFELLDDPGMTATPVNSLGRVAMYDTSSLAPANHPGGEFTSGSDNSGTARTLLDRGNLQIDMR